MREWASQSHVKWYCRYHVVIVPKYRKKKIYGRLRKEIGGILRKLCNEHKVELLEGHAMPDHVHLFMSIPPKFSVANTISYTSRLSAAKTQLYGNALLVKRILCEQCRTGRENRPYVRQESRGERNPRRADEDARTIGPFEGLHHTAPSGGGR